MKVVAFWFRRDLRLVDNRGLIQALESGYPVLPVFIFDNAILEELPADDPRVNFIYDSLQQMQEQLVGAGKGLWCKRGLPETCWKEIIEQYDLAAVYTNKDYEPYARIRDKKIHDLLGAKDIPLHRIKDQVIFEEREVVKNDGDPYTVYTPYKKRWLEQYNPEQYQPVMEVNLEQFHSNVPDFPTKEMLNIKASEIKVKPYSLEDLKVYEAKRNFPAAGTTSNLSPHLRFGTVSVRQIMSKLDPDDAMFQSELIWREFFMQILYNFPKVVKNNFRAKYDGIAWRNNEEEFKRWCEGKTGYPMVDAGMRELNATGYMHNRVRMVTASFLCKHLLIDWRWGEAYFAEKLLDFELASNNGNWQWAAGTGCDAAPYFRIFNPTTQIQKFDKEGRYIKHWVPEWKTDEYAPPMVEHKMARERALAAYKEGIEATTA